MTLWDEVRDFGKDVGKEAYNMVSAPFKIRKNHIEKAKETTLKYLDIGAKYGLPIATTAGWIGHGLGMWDVDTVKEWAGLLGATGATAYGTYAYLAGKWPFMELDDNEIVVTQYIDARKARAIKGPRTVWFISPLERIAKGNNGREGRIDSRNETVSVSDLSFITREGISGKLDAQYTFAIETPEDAEKFYWNLEDRESLKRIIRAKIGSAIKFGKEINFSDGEDSLYLSLLRELTSVKNDYGANVKSVQFSNYELDEGSKRMLRILPTEVEKAKASAVEALQHGVNQQQYFNKAKEILTDPATGNLRHGITNKDVLNLANAISERAISQKIAENGGIIVQMSFGDFTNPKSLVERLSKK